jgi:hypothetical protein
VNPELLRNLWLEITPQRLIAMPAVLFLIFGLVLISDDRGALPDAAWWTGLAIGVLYGARQAAGAVMGEVAGRTWDSQRASALTPAQMALGKLFGATSYAWYGTILCALVHLGAGGAAGEAASLILRTGLAHGVALFASLVLLGLGGRRLVMTSLPHLAGIIAAGAADILVPTVDGLAGMMSIAHANGTMRGVLWFGLPLSDAAFLRLSNAMFWGWSIVGCVALLRGELNVPRRLPVWPLFLGFVALYAAGLGAGTTAPVTLVPAFVALCLLTSCTALLEPKSRRSLALLFAGAREGLFPSLQALLAALALGIALIVLPSTSGWREREGQTLLPLAAMLFLARDIALVRLVSLRSGGLRGAVAAIVWFAVLYGMVPAVLAGAGAEGALVLFYPLQAEGASAATALILGAPAVQAALLWSLLVRAVRRSPAAVMARPG